MCVQAGRSPQSFGRSDLLAVNCVTADRIAAEPDNNRSIIIIGHVDRPVHVATLP